MLTVHRVAKAWFNGLGGYSARVSSLCRLRRCDLRATTAPGTFFQSAVINPMTSKTGPVPTQHLQSGWALVSCCWLPTTTARTSVDAAAAGGAHQPSARQHWYANCKGVPASIHFCRHTL
jgi:hypothetical protein